MRAWLLEAAQEAANAAKEGGFMGFHAERVSEGEQQMLDRLNEVLAAPTAQDAANDAALTRAALHDLTEGSDTEKVAPMGSAAPPEHESEAPQTLPAAAATTPARSWAPALGGSMGPAHVLALQRAAGNQAVVSLLAPARVQRQPRPDAPSLDDRYRTALASGRETGNFGLAAEVLNGFSRPDIIARLATLSDEEIGYLHIGAVNNPAVGPDSQVAQMTAPGAPRASTVGPSSTKAPPKPASAPAAAPAAPASAEADARIQAMDPTDRLIEAFHRAPINAAFREKILSMMTPDVLVAAIISFAAVFLVSQLTPVGWAADITLGLSVLFVGTALIKATKYLIEFAEARNATTSKQIDTAAVAFANAVAEIEVDALLFLIAKGAKGAARGGPPVPPSGGVLLGTQGDALVVVAVQTVPASVAGQLGILGGGTAMSIMGDPDDPDFDDDPEVSKWEKKFEKEPRRERISDANKLELENSGWLKQLMPDAGRRRQFMKWLERRHGTREGIDHEHLRPGSPEARAAVEEFNLEEP